MLFKPESAIPRVRLTVFNQLFDPFRIALGVAMADERIRSPEDSIGFRPDEAPF